MSLNDNIEQLTKAINDALLNVINLSIANMGKFVVTVNDRNTDIAVHRHKIVKLSHDNNSYVKNHIDLSEPIDLSNKVSPVSPVDKVSSVDDEVKNNTANYSSQTVNRNECYEYDECDEYDKRGNADSDYVEHENSENSEDFEEFEEFEEFEDFENNESSLSNSFLGHKRRFSEISGKRTIRNFYAKLKEYVEFHKINGRTPLSKTTCCFEKSQYMWQSTMQSLYRSKALRQEYVDALENLPFWKWQTYRTVNNISCMQLERLKAFFAAHNKLPSISASDGNEVKLAKWCDYIRRRYHSGILDVNFAKLLEQSISDWHW